ncbi:MFS transporter [Streptomyces flaveolus]|uniref:MFS transporter n=1 Tax=Streptomyces flaveolus TaxID=67297 RepID=A0ABV1VES7_9ACTN
MTRETSVLSGAGTASPARPLQVAAASLVGTAVEWYDFFLYGSAAALIFGRLFFPSTDPAAGTLLAFGTYAVGFVARPLGGIVFGHFGDKVSRKKMLVFSLLLMGIATFVIGLLPTYATIGVWSPVLLLLCRLAQGFAAGGEWGGAVLITAEQGDDDRRGFWSSWPQAGVPLGNLLSAAVLWLMSAVLSQEAFQAWGWRIPFLLSAVMVAVGLWVRLRIEESPVFAASREAAARQEHRRAPLVEVFRSYKREIVIAIGLRLAENISYYIFTIVVITYSVTYLGLPDQMAISAVLFASIAQFFLTPAMGALSDRLGRRPVYLAGAVGAGAWGFAFFPLLDTANLAVTTAAIFIGLIFNSMMYAPQAALFSELFGTSVRYSGTSFASQAGSVLAGGLAPLISVALLGSVQDKNSLGVSIYLAVAAAITSVAVLACKETARSSLTHDRTLTYDGAPGDPLHEETAR